MEVLYIYIYSFKKYYKVGVHWSLMFEKLTGKKFHDFPD